MTFNESEKSRYDKLPVFCRMSIDTMSSLITAVLLGSIKEKELKDYVLSIISPEEEYLTVDQAIKELNISRVGFYREFVRTGKIERYKLGYKKSEVINLITNKKR